MNVISVFAPIAAAIGLIVAFALSAWIKKNPEGNDRMKEISGYIREGAMAFLKREYITMVIVVVVIAVVLSFALKPTVGILYVIGACLSVASPRSKPLVAMTRRYQSKDFFPL